MYRSGLAALVLIKDKGTPTAEAIDAYLPYVRAYNGAGAAADAYAARVIADAHSYRGLDRVRLHADLTILSCLASRLAQDRARAVPLAA